MRDKCVSHIVWGANEACQLYEVEEEILYTSTPLPSHFRDEGVMYGVV